MPIVLDRRSFLKHAAGSVTLAAAAARLRADVSIARLALLSDTHIAADKNDTYRGFSPYANLTTVVDQVGRERFDLAVVNGDLARLTGETADYTQFASLMKPIVDKTPTLLTMGNHDGREHAQAALVSHRGTLQPVAKKWVTTIDAGPVSLVFLDSLLATNVTPGQLGKAQRNWLASYLDANASKTLVVFVHHQPDPENDGALVDAEALLAILRPRRAVKALFFGHTHEYRREQQDGLHLVNLPAVGYNFSDPYPVGWVDATFSPRIVTLKLHAIAGERREDGKVAELSWR
ncbi:MAG: metallophosphoesterase family protein [Bryobacteraceae bacterium]